jgi:hypothetical protein
MSSQSRKNIAGTDLFLKTDGDISLIRRNSNMRIENYV